VGEKESLHPLIGKRPNLEVVWRVQVEQGKAFNAGTHIEDIAVYGLDASIPRANGSIGVEFNTVE
jgi:hypothetical protein